MTTIPVILRDKNQIEQFLKINSNSDCQIDVNNGRTYADGKSMIGILSLGLFRPLQVSLIGEDEKINKTFDAYKQHDLIAES
jgi:phosphotransferase system HPr-like phosphotransfer protein